jgi:hypothetical protein
MSKIIEYRCNLCGERWQAEQVVGLYFIGNRGGGIEPRLPPATENHFCNHCLNALSSSMSRLIAFQADRKS